MASAATQRGASSRTARQRRLVQIGFLVPAVVYLGLFFGYPVVKNVVMGSQAYIGLILADSAAGVPFSIILLRAFMQGIPASIVEAAYVDGAGPVRAFVSVVLPIARNALITAALFTFLFAWGDFLFALTLTTSETLRPITLGLYSYIGGFVNDWSPVMATAVLSSLPAIALLIVAQRYVAAGVTGGAVKS